MIILLVRLTAKMISLGSSQLEFVSYRELTTSLKLNLYIIYFWPTYVGLTHNCQVVKVVFTGGMVKTTEATMNKIIWVEKIN